MSDKPKEDHEKLPNLTDYVCEEVEKLYNELGIFKFDKVKDLNTLKELRASGIVFKEIDDGVYCPPEKEEEFYRRFSKLLDAGIANILETQTKDQIILGVLKQTSAFFSFDTAPACSFCSNNFKFSFEEVKEVYLKHLATEMP